MNASKNKGKSYERDVANHLSSITGLSFLRVPNSGAYVGGGNFFRTEQLSQEQVGMFEGDIITPKEWNHVRIECKWYKSFSWHQLFNATGEGVLNSWIKQAEQGTKPLWFLCFKINHCGEFIVFNSKFNDSFTLPLNILKYCPNEKFLETGYTLVSKDMFFEFNKDKIISLGVQNDSNNRDK